MESSNRSSSTIINSQVKPLKSNGFHLKTEDIAVALFAINVKGPYLDFLSLNQPLAQVMGTYSPYEEIQRLGISSMIAITQGSFYKDSLNLLHLVHLSNLRALVLSLVFDTSEDCCIHERYFQVGFILHKKFIRKIDDLIYLEDQLLASIKPILLPWVCKTNEVPLSILAEELKQLLITCFNS